MSEAILIRPARAEDADACVAIALAEWEAIYQGYREQLGDELFAIHFPSYRATKESGIRANLASGTAYVTEVDGRVAGFIHYLYDAGRRIGTISNNAVSGDFRGRGIGPRQYEFVFDRLRELGAVGVRVQTGLDEAHAPARRAYQKAGFEAHTDSITYYKKL
jgi:GNAT superfamily N-acetyltransferase